MPSFSRSNSPHEPGPRRSRSLAALIVASAVGLGCATANNTRVSLRIEAPQEDRDAEVYVDGNYVGQVQALQEPSTGPVQLGPGLHRLEIRKPGRFPQQQTVEVTRKSPPEIVVHAELLEDPP